MIFLTLVVGVMFLFSPDMSARSIVAFSSSLFWYILARVNIDCINERIRKQKEALVTEIKELAEKIKRDKDGYKFDPSRAEDKNGNDPKDQKSKGDKT